MWDIMWYFGARALKSRTRAEPLSVTAGVLSVPAPLVHRFSGLQNGNHADNNDNTIACIIFYHLENNSRRHHNISNLIDSES